MSPVAQPEVPAIYSSAIAAAANAMANAIVSTHTVNHMDCPQAFIVDAGDRLGQIDESVGGARRHCHSRKSAFSIAIGGKADIAFCGALVRF